MNVEVLLFALIGIVLSDNTCTYINQNKNLVSVDKVSTVTSGITDEIPLNVGESLTISCKDTVNTAFEYGEPTVYKCETASSDKVNLPLCVSKCATLENLDTDQKSVFVLADGTVVTGARLPKSTPVTIQCTEPYAQMFKQIDTQACELWNSDALCKKMCTLSSYSNINTDLSSTGIKPSLADPKYLQVGFSVSISCKSADFKQPMNAKVSHTCEQDHGDEQIVIENCTKMCRVPTAPTDTKYQATEHQLRQGETFTVKCTGDLKFPIDQKVFEVECQSDGTFPEPYPTCEATCKISAVDDSTTKLNTTVVGGLAQKESVEVSCADDTLLLPYGYKTPWIITCGPKNLTIDVPVCQQTCAVPGPIANAELSHVDNTRMKLREPITATCKDYYSYEVDSGTSKTREFTCSDTSGAAEVKIDEFCYVYAELSHSSTGTAKVELTGEINDNKDYSNGNTVVDFRITGANTDLTKQAKPNVAVEVDVGSYEPLKVEVKTTSEVGGSKRVITITEQDIYPGPPSPAALQQNSTSSTVFVKLAHPANDVLDDIIRDHLIKYTIQYMDNDDSVTINVTKDNRTDMTKLPNLSPATSYTIKTTTMLPDLYGGQGDPTLSTVYTGPSQVNDATLKSTVIEDAVKVEWASVDKADKYEVALFENGISSGTQWPKVPKIEYAKFKAETTYELNIRAIREVDINDNGKPVPFFGDVLNKQLSGPPAAPSEDQFEVTNTSDSVTVRRVPSNDDQSTRTNMVQNDGIEYIVFFSHNGKNGQKTLKAEENELLLKDLNASSTYDIKIAQAVGEGYGMKTFLKSFKTADCGSMNCTGCQESTQFKYVMFNTTVTVKCLENTFMERKDETGEEKYIGETTLLCNGHNQYVYQDDESQIVSEIACSNQEKVIIVPKDYTLYYILAGVGVFLVLILVIIVVVIRRRRTQGTYNAKRAKETSKNGVASPDMTMEPKTFVNDEAFFENKWDNDLLRAQSGRSKATSYGSQELRMTIADSDSGITEDLENTYFNPALYSTNCEDDTVSTKSALV